MKKKRAQVPVNAGNAATLIIFVALLIIIYMFMIPPKDRDEILGINQTTGNGNTENLSGYSSILLDEAPGSLYPTQQTDFTHPINQIVLTSTQEDKVLIERDSLFVSNSKLNKIVQTLHFNSENVNGLIQSLYLSFSVDKAKGRLIIEFNGHEITNKVFPEGTINPISLPTEFLKDKNEIKIYTSDVGLALFSKNIYELSDIKLLASTKDSDSQRAYSNVILSNEEIQYFNSGYLRFTAECTGSPGILKIYCNGNLLISKIPNCDSPDKVDLTKLNLFKGKNDLSFQLTRGNVYLSNLALVIKLKEPKWPVYYFEVNQSLMDYINNKNVLLRINFVDDHVNKQADININNRKIYLDENNNFYERSITDYLIVGNNYIKIVPTTDLDITSLKVVIT